MGKKILIVDDDDDIIKILNIRLKANAYEVIMANDGKDAWEKIKERHPDLIVADLVMPNISGWALAEQIKNDENFKHIPIILLSAMISRDGQPGEKESGDYMMAKPFSIDELIKKIEELLQRAK